MKYFIINSPVAPIHKNPEFQSEMVTQAILGETCTLIKTHKNWSYVQQWDKYEGWVHSFYGVFSKAPYDSTKTFFGFSKWSENGNEKRKVIYGSQLKLIESNQVVFPDGWLGTAPKEFRASPLKPTRDNILLFAKQFLGVPYLWGGKSVLGVDCSGLVQSVFWSVGIELPRDGSQQAVHFSDYKISLNTVKSGDLLFFGRNDSISHVAISLGGLNILHSQGWVKEESLDKFHANFNEKLLNIFQFSSSVEHLMIP